MNLYFSVVSGSSSNAITGISKVWFQNQTKNSQAREASKHSIFFLMAVPLGPNPPPLSSLMEIGFFLSKNSRKRILTNLTNNDCEFADRQCNVTGCPPL